MFMLSALAGEYVMSVLAFSKQLFVTITFVFAVELPYPSNARRFPSAKKLSFTIILDSNELLPLVLL